MSTSLRLNKSLRRASLCVECLRYRHLNRYPIESTVLAGMLHFAKTALVVGAFMLALNAFAAPKAGAAKPIDFSRDIRPILSDNCFACHGPDEKERKAKLRLDRHEDALKPAKSGDYAIVPGDPKKSMLVERIMTDDEDEVMPPPKTKKKLSAQQKELLTRWIVEGAKWQSHWAFETPKRPTPPEVKNKKWVGNE